MRKWKIFGIFALALCLVGMSIPSQAAIQHYRAAVQLYDSSKRAMQGQAGPSDVVSTAIITYQVLAVGSNTAETLYKPSGPSTYGGSKTNPVTTTVFGTDNYKIDFWCDPTDATSDRYVDLIVVDITGGFTAVVHNFDPYTPTVYIDVTKGVDHMGVIWFGGTTTEISTGVSLGVNTLLKDVRVEVITAANAATLNIGTLSTGGGGLAQGLRSAVLLTNTGHVLDIQVSSAAANQFYGASTYGSLLWTTITGTGTSILPGGRTFKGFIVTGTTTGQLTYAAGSTVAAGYIYYDFIVLR
jgi:tetrahydromethanopterin S-methyltransferase subunit F